MAWKRIGRTQGTRVPEQKLGKRVMFRVPGEIMEKGYYVGFSIGNIDDRRANDSWCMDSLTYTTTFVFQTLGLDVPMEVFVGYVDGHKDTKGNQILQICMPEIVE